MAQLCVIFDLDGTLVDSEELCNQAFLDLLPELGHTVQTLTHRYRGKKLASILADIEKQLNRRLPINFESRYRQRVSELFALDLKPTLGAREMLETTIYSRCIASSGPPEKIRQALHVSGPAAYFGDNIFSSYEVGSWKPDPGLFLHAASAMGFSPSHCVVIEDSEVGIAAAAAAGIRALQYIPSGDSLAQQTDTTFTSMAELPALLDWLATSSSLS